jgi:RHS repeat-associated protein
MKDKIESSDLFTPTKSLLPGNSIPSALTGNGDKMGTRYHDLFRMFFIVLSLVIAQSVTIQAGTITAAEYFIDTDPGQGSGTVLAARDGAFDSNLENVDIALNTSSLTIGVHNLFIRMKNDADVWGTPRKVPFNIDGNQYIAAQEYYIDTDPGAGNGFSLTAVDGAFDQKWEQGTASINTSSLTAGLHTLYVRAKNAEGHWGAPRQYKIEIIDQPTLSAMEYYVDSDPGAGNGTPMASNDGSFFDIRHTATGTLNTSNLSYGAHTIFARAKNSFAMWGATQNVGITVQSPLVTLISPSMNQSISAEYIVFQWNFPGSADRFDFIIDDDSTFTSPELVKDNIRDANGLVRSFDTLFAVRGWFADKTYYWKVFAYSDGATYSSSKGAFSFSSIKQPQPVWGPVLRAYNSGDKDHFYCTQQQQQNGAILRGGYRPEKPQGFVSVLPFNDPDMAPIYRIYTGSLSNRTAQCHFYTINDAERDSCIRRGWIYEGIIGFAYKNYHPGLVAMHHLYLFQVQTDTTIRDHFYTVNEFERLNAIKQYNFKDLGILAYVSPTTDTISFSSSLNCPSVGSGIDPLFGSLSHYEAQSFSIPEGRMSLSFSHQYNSLGVLLKTSIRSLGYGWSHTYSACLTNNDGSIKIFWPGGGYNEYDLSTFARKTRGIYDSLTKISDTIFEIRTKSQVVYRFSMIHKADSIAVLTSIKDRNNNVEQCSYDTSGNLLTVTGPKGRTLTFSYYIGQDSSFLIKSVKDPANRTIGFAYDTSGQLVAYTNANGDTTHYGYDTAWRFEHLLDKITQPKGNIFINVYDTSRSGKCLHRISEQKVITPGSPTQCIKLDYTNTDFVKVLDSKDNPYKFYYGPPKEGLISSLMTAYGNAFYEYKDSINNPGLPTKIIDGQGYVTTDTFDRWGNVLRIDKPYNIRHQFAYTALNDLSRYIGPRNDSTTYTYDANGNLIRVKNYRGQTSVAYRSDGLIDSVIDPMGNSSKLSYNTYGDVIGVRDPLNNSWQSTYDIVSRLINSTNPKGQVSSANYSQTDLITSAIGPIKDTTKYVYDRNGRLTTIQNAKHYNTILGYNSLNMLDSIQNPLGKTIRFGYTGTLLTKKTFASNDTLGIAYDSAGRIKSYSGAANATFTYDLNDNIKTVTENAKQMTFGYDSLNRLVGYSYYSSNNSDSISYGWDKAGNLKYVVYNEGGGTVNYSYYPDNLLYKVTDWLNDTTTYYYRNDGSLDYCIYPNGVKCFYTYDKAGRITALANVKTNGDTINGYAFTLDSLGNITGETRKEPYSAPQISADNTTYMYNAGNQLLKAGADSFAYDNNGNMFRRISGGVTTSYGFDPLNKLLTIDSSGVRKATYTYDVYGNRKSATRNGTTVNYELDFAGSMSNVLTEKDGNGNPLYFYIYGLGMVYRIKNGGAVECYHYDLRGSTIAMTNSSQAITHKYAYGSYGEMVVDSGINDNLFKFVGKYGVMDESNGMQFMRARYYDSKIGRFLSEDPVWGVNLYGYAEGNPVIYNDPTGTTVSLSCSAGEGIFFKGSIIFSNGDIYGSGGAGVGWGGGCSIDASSAVPQTGSSVNASCEVGYGPASGEVSIDESGEIDGSVSYSLGKFKTGLKSECSMTANGTVKLFSSKTSTGDLNEHFISPGGFRNTTLNSDEHFVQGGKNERLKQGGKESALKKKAAIPGPHVNSTDAMIQ